MLPASAAADWKSVTPPWPSGGGLEAFAGSGSAWLAVVTQTDGSYAGELSTNAGQSWQPVALGGSPVTNVSVGPDGAFYLTVQPGSQGQAEVQRVTGSGAVSTAATLTGLPSGGFVSAPAFDGSGNAWVAEAPNDGSQLTLTRVDGSQSYSATPPTPGYPQLESIGGRIYVASGQNAYTVSGGSLQLSPWPVWSAASDIVAENGISFDGGNTWVPTGGQSSALGTAGGLTAVHGAGEYFNGNELIAPFSSRLLESTGLTGPVDTGGSPLAQDYWATSAGTVAAGYGVPGYLAVWPGAVPARPASRNGSPTDAGAQAAIARVNQYRSLVGLPPIGEDPLIDRAAFNHSHYWTLNGAVTGLALHDEISGKPGFTGQLPSDRCAAAGTTCGSEVIYPGLAGPAAVDGWVDTVFHRQAILDPTTTFGGYGIDPAAKLPMSVMDFDSDSDIQSLVPVVYPVGTYLGPTAFDNGEVPDPVAQCNQDGQPLPQHPSLPVTISPPVGAVLALRVIDTSAGNAAVAGCAEPGYFGWFMAKAPWSDGHTYQVQFTWGTAAVPQNSVSSFTVAAGAPTGIPPGGSGSAVTKLTVKLSRKSIRRGGVLKMTIGVPSAGKLKWSFHALGRARGPVSSGSYRMPLAGTISTPLVVPRRCRPGRYLVTVTEGSRKVSAPLKVTR